MDIAVHTDKIFNLCNRVKDREAGRASDAGEDRESIGAMLELTGVNKKAFAFVRALDKMESDKRDDVLRSLTPLLGLFDGRWNGQATPDMFTDEPDAVAPTDDAAFFDQMAEAPVDQGELPADFVDEVNDFEAALAEAAE